MEYIKITIGFKSGNEKTFIYKSSKELDYFHEQLANAAKNATLSLTLIDEDDYGLAISWPQIEWFEVETKYMSVLFDTPINSSYEDQEESIEIKRNSAKCLKCGDEIESTHRHDFKYCSCENIFVDGGKDYCRHGHMDKNQYENTSKFEYLNH